jgi:hypothetical protein
MMAAVLGPFGMCFNEMHLSLQVAVIQWSSAFSLTLHFLLLPHV